MYQKEVFMIDSNGYIVDKYVADFNNQGISIEEFPENVITVSLPNGLYRPKWNGTNWVEDMSQEEINELKNQPQPITQEQRISDLELLVLQLGGVI